MKEPQELHCHNCDNYVRFNLDLSVDGKYKLKCPKCGHLHYRIVKNGKIIDTRWGRDPSQEVGWVLITATSYSTTSTYDNYSGTGSTGGTSSFFHNAWASATTTSSY